MYKNNLITHHYKALKTLQVLKGMIGVSTVNPPSCGFLICLKLRLLFFDFASFFLLFPFSTFLLLFFGCLILRPSVEERKGDVIILYFIIFFYFNKNETPTCICFLPFTD
jgi:hypothetical protein